MDGQRGFGASSGHAQLAGVLNSPFVVDELVETLRYDTIFTKIATTKWYDKLECGDTVELRSMPATRWHPHIPNQDLERDQLEICKRYLKIGYQQYANLKVDDVSVDYVCKYGELQEAWKQQILIDANEIIESTVLRTIHMEASEFNQGVNAGARTHSFNLGAYGAPFPMSGDTFLTFVEYASLVLSEAKIPMGGRFMVMPTSAQLSFSDSPLVNASMIGDCVQCSPLRTGKYYTDVQGFELFFSPFLPQCADISAPETVTYFVLFGHKEALAYTVDLGNFQVVQMEKAFGHTIRILLTYGAGAYRPEGLGFGYITVDIRNPSA